MLLIAGAVLFLAPAAHAGDRGDHHRGGHGGRHEGWRGDDRGYGHGHYRHRRGDHGVALYIRSMTPFYPPAYTPTYYYPPAPVYTPLPAAYVPAPATRYDGRYCREYTRDVLIGGQWQQSYGRACLQPGGAWEIES